MVISFIYRDRIHESMQEREFMTRAVLIRMPDSMYDDIEALRKELNIPSTSSMIRVLIREALFNHSARKRLDEAAAAHDKGAIDAIAKEVALIYGAGSWAHEGASWDGIRDEEEGPACPVCEGGEGFLLGRLGRRSHFRCRDCGIEWSLEEEAICPQDRE